MFDSVFKEKDDSGGLTREKSPFPTLGPSLTAGGIFSVDFESEFPKK